MAVFRVEKNSGYTVMSNHHLRNQELSLKAKGLLSQMLSLPDNWDYTLKGLSLINREKIDAIREAIRELERAGYIVRSRERDEKGRLFARLEEKDPEHFAVRQYKKFLLSAGKTRASILVSCGARLAPFDIRELRELMEYDEMELDTLGDRKTALFLIVERQRN